MVVHTLPFPNASDHKPIALAFTDILTQRSKREAGAARIPYVPEWLFQERAFVEELESGFEAWKGGRARGLAGIEQFNDLVAATAKEFLATQQILAKTVQQKFDIATALLGTMQCNRGRVSVKRLCKWLSSYPTLKEILAVEWSDDDEEVADGENEVQVHGEEAIIRLVEELLSQLVQERTTNSEQEDIEAVVSESPSACEPNARTLKIMKGLLRSNNERVTMLWDAEEQTFGCSREEMFKTLKSALTQRQGTDNGDSTRGHEFLQNWSCDLSSCRSVVTYAEMMAILLDIQLEKA